MILFIRFFFLGLLVHLSGATTTPNPEEVCYYEDGKMTLQDGAVRQLPGCQKLKCEKKNGHLILMYISCPTSLAVPSPNCKLLPREDGIFPECCVDRFECVEVVRTLVPVRVTSDTASDDTRRDILRVAGIIPDENPEDAILTNEISEGLHYDAIDRKQFKDKTRKFIRQEYLKKGKKNKNGF